MSLLGQAKGIIHHLTEANAMGPIFTTFWKKDVNL